MKKEVTRIQVKSEIESVESEIRRLEYHLTGVNDEKKKTMLRLAELRGRERQLKSYL